MPMRSLLNFLRYHNTVPIILGVLLFGTGVLFAAHPQVRETFFPTDAGPIGPPPQPNKNVLLSTDVEDFSMEFQITSVEHLDDLYRVQYTYRTLEVGANGWQITPKSKVLEIYEQTLGHRDVGLYAAEQIGQVMDREVAYLGEVRNQNQAIVQAKTETTQQYEALIGKTLNQEDKTFSGYVPVIGEHVKESEPSLSGQAVLELPDGQSVTVPPILSKEEIRNIIIQAIADFLVVESPPLPEPSANTQAVFEHAVEENQDVVKEDAATSGGTFDEGIPEADSDVDTESGP